MKSAGSASSLISSAGAIKPDGTANEWGIYSTAGVEEIKINVNGAGDPFFDTAGSGSGFHFKNGGTEMLLLGSAGLYLQNSAVIKRFAGVNTSGFGVAAVYQTSVQSQSNAAPTTVSFTPAAAAGTLRISAFLDVTTGTTITFKSKLTYTDPAGSTITDRPGWYRENSGVVTQPTANTVDRFAMMPYVFGIDNSGGTISLADDAGTYTTCAYRLQVLLEELV